MSESGNAREFILQVKMRLAAGCRFGGGMGPNESDMGSSPEPQTCPELLRTDALVIPVGMNLIDRDTDGDTDAMRGVERNTGTVLVDNEQNWSGIL